jgi:DNA replication protein DnaC
VKTTACHSCGQEVTFEPIAFRGLEVGTPRFCDDCIEREEREEEQRERAERHRARIENSGLPVRLQGLSLPDTELGRLGAKWATGELRGLCFSGPVGVGKTYTAAGACWLRLQRAGCRWVSVARLMTQLRAGFQDEARAAASRAVTGEGAIILDDLDKVNPTDYGREVIFAAIDGRVEAGAPLLVTTNLGPREIGERLGDAVMSRLVGYCEQVKMVGEDKRLAA